MNNKGFAITGILYTILIMFLVFISMMLFNLQNRKTILDELKVDAVNAVESDNNYEYLLNEINNLKSEMSSLKSEIENPAKTLWSGTATIGDTIELSDSYKNYKLLLLRNDLGIQFVTVSDSYLSWSGVSGSVNIKSTFQTINLGYGMAKINSTTSLTIMNSGFLYNLYDVSNRIGQTTETSSDMAHSTIKNYSPRKIYALYGIK